jgi:hypothetical protein
MKKAFMLVAAIALLAAPVFAEVEVTISGAATTSVGYNLDASDFGMLSDISSDVSLAIGSLDGESMGEGNWYGVIELTGAALAFGTDVDGDYLYVYGDDEDDDVDDVAGTVGGNPAYVATDYVLTAPDVTAKITNGNVYVQLASQATFDADYVVGVDNDPFEFAAPDTTGSITVGGAFGPATVAVEFGMEGSYEDDGLGNGVAFGANLGLDFDVFTADIAYAGAYAYAADMETGFAAQLGLNMAPVTVTYAFDGQLLSGGFTYETSLGVDLAIDPITVGIAARYAADDLDTKLTVGLALDMFTADAFFGLYDLTTTIAWATGVDLTVTPVSGIAFAAGWGFDSASVMSAYANVEFTELIDNVTFGLGWENANDMLGNDADETDLGQIVASVGIAF